jgi:site-specific DNA recombinase
MVLMTSLRSESSLGLACARLETTHRPGSTSLDRAVQCAESGSCQDAKTFYLKTVESAVLAGLENEMRQPRVIAEYVLTYHEERKRLSAKANAKRAHLELRLGELNREIDRLVDAIAKGHGNPAVFAS